MPIEITHIQGKFPIAAGLSRSEHGRSPLACQDDDGPVARAALRQEL
jgi:hypothetical protein